MMPCRDGLARSARLPGRPDSIQDGGQRLAQHVPGHVDVVARCHHQTIDRIGRRHVVDLTQQITAGLGRDTPEPRRQQPSRFAAQCTAKRFKQCCSIGFRPEVSEYRCNGDMCRQATIHDLGGERVIGSTVCRAPRHRPTSLVDQCSEFVVSELAVGQHIGRTLRPSEKSRTVASSMQPEASSAALGDGVAQNSSSKPTSPSMPVW